MMREMSQRFYSSMGGVKVLEEEIRHKIVERGKIPQILEVKNKNKRFNKIFASQTIFFHVKGILIYEML